MAYAPSPTKTCGEVGCSRPHRARGLCNTHYNASHYTSAQRHPKVSVPCEWCGKATLKERRSEHSARFCSLEHRDLWRSYIVGTNLCAVPRWHPAHPESRASVAAPEPKRRVFVAGRCQSCDAPFVATPLASRSRTCSTRCAKRIEREVRRARERKAYVERVYRQRIYQRDGWRCKLCNRKVRRDAEVPHPLAPTLDHIVPLAQGGTHEPANVQCAHFRCNSVKGDRGHAQQLMLIG